MTRRLFCRAINYTCKMFMQLTTGGSSLCLTRSSAMMKMMLGRFVASIDRSPKIKQRIQNVFDFIVKNNFYFNSFRAGLADCRRLKSTLSSKNWNFFFSNEEISSPGRYSQNFLRTSYDKFSDECPKAKMGITFSFSFKTSS